MSNGALPLEPLLLQLTLPTDAVEAGPGEVLVVVTTRDRRTASSFRTRHEALEYLTGVLGEGDSDE